MPRKNEPASRLCIVTRQSRPTAELIRFVIDPDGAVVADLRHRLPGRGVWVTGTAVQIADAERRKLFPRAFKGPARVEPGLAERVEERLRAQALGALSLARKAGELVVGTAKVEAALAAGSVAALIHAADAASDGVRKLDALALRHPTAHPSIRFLTSEEMSLALGRPHVIHAALLAGRASQHFIDEVAVLARYSKTGSRDGNDFSPPSAEAPQGTATHE